MGWAATDSALIPGDSCVESSSAKTILCFGERRKKTQQSVLLPRADQDRPQEPRTQASPWNISIFALMGVVVVISMVLLGRSIKENRKQKKLPREKPTPEVLTEARTKDDNNLNILRESLLSEKLNLAEVDIELKARILTDPLASES
ncbi:PREDICTED: organic solute transporter subunit beta isoform X1 [Myotis davidii]|uniref:Organic solute transporter subunit beta n=1 Tax=Myotis davidii TaxID=225400 RepID=L5LGT5_MYODS|nr:PREDICTED: organic solute transporter subunit beta isoform X1 [Myotis davidii]ELK24863.1 Organic solute transporter subunit beta [Myotis davidii]